MVGDGSMKGCWGPPPPPTLGGPLPSSDRQGQSGGSIGTAEAKGEGGKGISKRPRMQRGERPMGIGFVERSRGSGERPIGAASFRQQSKQASCQTAPNTTQRGAGRPAPRVPPPCEHDTLDSPRQCLSTYLSCL